MSSESTEWTQVGFKNGATITLRRNCSEVIQQMAASPKVPGATLHLISLTASDGTPALVHLEEIIFVSPISQQVVLANRAKRANQHSNNIVEEGQACHRT